MSIATKNTITNFWVKMEKPISSNNNNFNNQNNLLQLPQFKDTNNNNINNASAALGFCNRIKLSNMLINNNSSEGESLAEFSFKNQEILPPMGFDQVQVSKLPMAAVSAKVRNSGILARKVLVIYTGGTIGMIRNPDSEGLVPIPNMFEKTVRSFPNFHDETFVKSEEDLLVLPKTDDTSSRVTYKIVEYNPLLDSSNMTIDDWVFIAQDIKTNYEEYDGFVVLHGTDTMAYTASALSFMLENLGKSVVVTGSQIPLFESRSDGKENFLGALIMAGQYVIPEVSLYFGNKLFRGNRTTKVSSDRLNAFDSPNFSPLASLGINIELDRSNLLKQTKAPFQLSTALNRNVALLRLYPSITAQTVKAFLQAPMEGVVLQTYGAGNFPTNRLDLLKELEDASRRGVIIVNCTQCGHGTVAAIYETGVKTESAGVIPGFDMTCEAALGKLSYVLGRDDWSLEQKREMMKVSLRGELTSPVKLATTASAKDFVMDLEDAEQGLSLPVILPSSQSQKNSNFNNNWTSPNQGPPLNVARIDEPSLSKVESSTVAVVSPQNVLNNGDVVAPIFQPHATLNMNDLASLLGHQPGRSPMWQIASIIFAGQLLLLFCLAVVL